MKKKNFLLLGLGYAAGLLVALKFSDSGKGKKLAEIGEDVKSIHKNLWTEAEAKLFTEENRMKVAELKAKALGEIESFRKEAEKTVAEISRKGGAKKEEVEAKFDDLYARRKEILDLLLEDAGKIAESAVDSGEDVAQRLRKKIEVLAKDLRKEFETTSKNIRKKFQ